jgi:hypothetical protein
MRRVAKIRQRLGGNVATASPIPPKPKGMWRRTYERLREQAFHAEERADQALLPHLVRLLALGGGANQGFSARSASSDHCPTARRTGHIDRSWRG